MATKVVVDKKPTSKPIPINNKPITTLPVATNKPITTLPVATKPPVKTPVKTPTPLGPDQIRVGIGIVDIKGLTPAQIQKVKDAAKNGGGSKSSIALAKQFTTSNKAAAQKTAQTKAAVSPAINKPKTNSGDLGIDAKTGAIDPNKAIQGATGAEMGDINRNVGLANTSETTDPYGNVVTNKIDSNGQVIRNVQGGQPFQSTVGAFQKAIGGYQGDLSGQVSQAQDANYNYITKDYGQQKQQETEDLKQELANRGIPLGSSLYDHQMQQLDSKWQGNFDQAKNQAINAGNQTLSTQSGVQNSNLGTLSGTANSFLSQVSPYQGTSGDVSGALNQAGQLTSGADQGKYGIDKNYAAQMAQINKKPPAAAAPAPEQPKGPVFNG